MRWLPGQMSSLCDTAVFLRPLIIHELKCHDTPHQCRDISSSVQMWDTFMVRERLNVPHVNKDRLPLASLFVRSIARGKRV